MSADIVRPHFGPKPTVTTDEYFGGCPECGKTEGYVNDGRDHWFCCDAHRTRWYIGSNLFSSWREPSSQEDIASTAKAMSYRVVEPVLPPRPPREEPDPANVITSPEEFGRWLDEVAALDEDVGPA